MSHIFPILGRVLRGPCMRCGMAYGPAANDVECRFPKPAQQPAPEDVRAELARLIAYSLPHELADVPYPSAERIAEKILAVFDVRRKP